MKRNPSQINIWCDHPFIFKTAIVLATLAHSFQRNVARKVLQTSSRTSYSSSVDVSCLQSLLSLYVILDRLDGESRALRAKQLLTGLLVLLCTEDRS